MASNSASSSSQVMSAPTVTPSRHSIPIAVSHSTSVKLASACILYGATPSVLSPPR
jgi:hypothetical protein